MERENARDFMKANTADAEFVIKRLQQMANAKWRADISTPDSALGFATSCFTHNFGHPKRVPYSAYGTHVILLLSYMPGL